MPARQRLEWTTRERDILALIARGKTNAEIAEQLGISFYTAKWHVSELISKLGVETREDVGKYWRQERSPLRRVVRGAALLSNPFALKLGLGMTAAAGTAIAAVTMFATFETGGSGNALGSDVPGADAAATTETASPIAANVNAAATGLDAQPSRTVDQPGRCSQQQTASRPGASCQPSQIPELLALDRGNCDYSNVSFTGLRERYSYVDFSGCTLAGADFSSVAANSWSFEGANLTGANLAGASVSGSNFRGAILRNADVSAVLAGADFTNADLTGATVVGVQANLASWVNTTCPDGTKSTPSGGCVGKGVWVLDPRSGGSRPGGDICPPPPGLVQWGAACPRSHYPEIVRFGPQAEGAPCQLRGKDLSDAVLVSIDLRGCDLAGVNFAGADLSGANLSGANLEGATFSGATLYYADLSHTSIANADFRDARLDNARFSDTDMAVAIFE